MAMYHADISFQPPSLRLATMPVLSTALLSLHLEADACG